MKSVTLITRLAASLLVVAAVTLVGCERKERILDVETPRGELKIDRSKDTGDVDIDLDIDDK